MTRPAWIWLGVAALWIGLAADARAGDLLGIVKIGAAPAPEKDRKRYPDGKAGGEEAPAGKPVQDVVIYLEGAKGGRGSRPAPEMAQKDKTFRPRVVPVKVGTAVNFPNKDQIHHNVFSYSKVKKFDLGKFASGATKAVTFDQPGVVKVFCEIHSHMKGYVIVLDNDAFTVPDEQGFFKISGIPPGTYKMVAWHPSFDPKEKHVTIGAKPFEVQIDF
jgi:plastocyanin